jgi:hypothetical protein
VRQCRYRLTLGATDVNCEVDEQLSNFPQHGRRWTGRPIEQRKLWMVLDADSRPVGLLDETDKLTKVPDAGVSVAGHERSPRLQRNGGSVAGGCESHGGGDTRTRVPFQPRRVP